MQFIFKNGHKQFFKDEAINGHYFSIGKLTETIYLGEGYATCATIHQATNCGVVVAFCINNILTVAEIIRKKYPSNTIVICADNDAYNETVNIGVQKATEAAKAINAKLVIPKFKNTKTNPTDFNDLMTLEGIEEVKNQLGCYNFSRVDSAETTNHVEKLTQKSQKESEKLDIIAKTFNQESNKNQLTNIIKMMS